MFKLVQKGNLKYYKISSFEESGLVRHGFSTRYGGVSEGCYSSMNLRLHSGDRCENVIENFRIICAELGIDSRRLVLSKQVHEDVVRCVCTEDAGNGIEFENKFESADSLITAERNLPITVFGADCVPLFFLDKREGVIATAHSGWRGTVKKIGQKAVLRMINDYGSKPENILAAIGPSIQEEHFEVGDEVAEQFIREFGDDTAVRYGKKYHANMQLAIEKQLREVGIASIDNCGICTYCEENLFFSHRRMNDQRGVMCGFLELI